MRYWDTSGIAALLIRDAHSGTALSLLEKDDDITTWWATLVECQSAIWNNERRGFIATADAREAERRLREVHRDWQEIDPSAAVREQAMRLLRVHDLRAADALQLAAALFASQEAPATLAFVTFDRRLARAAEREGFPLALPREGGL